MIGFLQNYSLNYIFLQYMVTMLQPLCVYSFKYELSETFNPISNSGPQDHKNLTVTPQHLTYHLALQYRPVCVNKNK